MNRTYERTIERTAMAGRRPELFRRALAPLCRWLRAKRTPKTIEHFNIDERREALARKERHAAAELSCRPWR